MAGKLCPCLGLSTVLCGGLGLQRGLCVGTEAVPQEVAGNGEWAGIRRECQEACTAMEQVQLPSLTAFLFFKLIDF
jgi:hypothetical protein